MISVPYREHANDEPNMQPDLHVPLANLATNSPTAATSAARKPK